MESSSWLPTFESKSEHDDDIQDSSTLPASYAERQVLHSGLLAYLSSGITTAANQILCTHGWMHTSTTTKRHHIKTGHTL